MWGKFVTIIALSWNVLKLKFEGDTMNLDTLKTVLKLVWPWILSVLATTVLPKLGWTPELVATVVKALDTLFVFYIATIGSNTILQLNKAGMMRGVGFRKP